MIKSAISNGVGILGGAIGAGIGCIIGNFFDPNNGG